MSKYLGTALRDDIKELLDESPMDLVDYQANEMLPELPVSKESGRIPVLPTSAGMKQLDIKRAPQGTFKRGKWVWSDNTYETFEYGYEEPVDNVQKKQNADVFDEEVVAGNIARNQLFIAREKRVVDALHNETTFTGATNLYTVTHEWDDTTNAVPFTNITAVADVIFAKSGIPRSELHLQLNEVIFRNVLRCDNVKGDIKYTSAIDTMNKAQKLQFLADFFAIKQVHIATSFADSTGLGIENATLERLWTDEYAMVYYPCPNVNSWRVKGLGRQPVWSGFGVADYMVEDYPEPQSDSIVVRVREYRGEFVNTRYGVLMKNMTT